MKRLLIVQNVPTQFDVPLYNQIADEKPFELCVIYTQTYGESAGYDPEIGRSTAWDHIAHESYRRIDLTEEQNNNLTEVVSLIEEFSPGLVLLSGYYPPLHRKLVKPLKQAGIKIGLRSDNTLPHSNFSGLKGILKRILLPIWLKRYDFWFPVGSLASDYLEQMSGVEKPSFYFSYNADNQWFYKNSRQRELIRTEMGLPEDGVVVLGIMKWHQREDPLTLIRAFKIFAKENPTAQLVLVGDGPLRKQVERELKPLGDRVATPGYVPYTALPPLYAAADIFVHPAPNEPWGVSVNEAMACGVPVIAASGVGAAIDLIEEDETGFVFDSGDVDELSIKLTKAKDQTGTDRKMSLRCLERMRQWGYSQTISSFEKALAKV